MNKLFLLSIILSSISCSKKLYYAYENKEEGSYCTFEVSKYDIIYRAVSNKHYLIKSYPTKEYVYITAPNNGSYLDEPKIEYGSILLYTKGPLLPIKMETISNYLGDYEKYLFYTKTKGDSLKLIVNIELMKKEPFFTDSDLLWFPPYLKKVDKIDYDKFNLPYKRKSLRRMKQKDIIKIEQFKK